MASVQPTTAGGWRVSVCKKGVRDTKTFPAGTPKKEATDWGTTREAEIIQEAKAPKPAVEDRTMGQLIEEWMADKLPKRTGFVWEGQRCRWFLANLTFIDVVVRELDADDIEDWIEERQCEVGAASINRDLQLLNPILKYGVRRKWLAVPPLIYVDRPENPAPRDVRITRSDEEAIVEALGYVRGSEPITARENLAVAFLLALETGMRRGELLQTEWKNVHETHIHLPAAITKTRTKRDVPLSPVARALVGLLRRDADRMFDSLTPKIATKLFKDARTRADRPWMHFHDTRHEAVTRLARKLDHLALARMIGHADINSLKIYYNETPQEIAAMLE